MDREVRLDERRQGVRFLVSEELDAEMEVSDSAEKVAFGLAGRARFAEERRVMLLALRALVEDFACGLISGSLAQLLPDDFVRLLDCVEVVSIREVLPDVVVDVLMNLDGDPVRSDCARS